MLFNDAVSHCFAKKLKIYKEHVDDLFFPLSEQRAEKYNRVEGVATMASNSSVPTVENEAALGRNVTVFPSQRLGFRDFPSLTT